MRARAWMPYPTLLCAALPDDRTPLLLACWPAAAAEHAQVTRRHNSIAATKKTRWSQIATRQRTLDHEARPKPRPVMYTCISTFAIPYINIAARTSPSNVVCLPQFVARLLLCFPDFPGNMLLKGNPSPRVNPLCLPCPGTAPHPDAA